MIKMERKITLEMDLELLNLMEFDTWCAIKAVVWIKPILQDSMAITNPIHHCFHPNYLPLIPTTILLSVIALICRHLLRIKWLLIVPNGNPSWSIMSAPPKFWYFCSLQFVERYAKIVGQCLPVSIVPLLLCSISGTIQSFLCLFGVITFMLLCIFLSPFLQQVML